MQYILFRILQGTLYMGVLLFHLLIFLTGVSSLRADSADMMGSLLFLWKSIKWVTLSKLRSRVLTTPSGSTSSKCFLPCPCIPVSTYCPGDPWDSRTRKSPSCLSSCSASFLDIGPWNQSSLESWVLWARPCTDWVGGGGGGAGGGDPPPRGVQGKGG